MKTTLLKKIRRRYRIVKIDRKKYPYEIQEHDPIWAFLPLYPVWNRVVVAHSRKKIYKRFIKLIKWQYGPKETPGPGSANEIEIIRQSKLG